MLVITAVNLGGLERTAFVTRWLLACSLLALAAVVVAGWSSDGTSLDNLTPLDAGLPDILRSAGFLFFAFAGYARIATLGEEVVDPEVTIPKAITRALTFVLVVYADRRHHRGGVDADRGARRQRRPAQGGRRRFADGRVGARRGDRRRDRLARRAAQPDPRRRAYDAGDGAPQRVPAPLAHVDRRRSHPVRAELAVVAVVLVLVVVVELHSAIALSGVAVLTYYAITNAAAFTLPANERRWPRWICVAGAIGCVAGRVPPTRGRDRRHGCLLLGVVIRRLAL